MEDNYKDEAIPLIYYAPKTQSTTNLSFINQFRANNQSTSDEVHSVDSLATWSHFCGRHVQNRQIISNE